METSSRTGIWRSSSVYETVPCEVAVLEVLAAFFAAASWARSSWMLELMSMTGSGGPFLMICGCQLCLL